MDMMRLDDMMARLDKHQPLTAYECLRLVMVAQAAASFTRANDNADDADERAESGGIAETIGAEDFSDTYNREKDQLFQRVREFMGWPGRPVKYLPEFLGGGAVQPHPFAQEGTF